MQKEKAGASAVFLAVVPWVLGSGCPRGLLARPCHPAVASQAVHGALGWGLVVCTVKGCSPASCLQGTALLSLAQSSSSACQNDFSPPHLNGLRCEALLAGGSLSGLAQKAAPGPGFASAPPGCSASPRPLLAEAISRRLLSLIHI